MDMRPGCMSGGTDQSNHIAGIDVLPDRCDDLAHVSINRIKLLIFITKVHAKHHGLPIWIIVVAGSLGEQAPVGPNDGAGTRGEDRRAIRRIDIDAGVNKGRRPDCTVAIVGERPIDLVGGDGTREIKMIVRRNRPWNRIERRPPTRDRRRTGRW